MLAFESLDELHLEPTERCNASCPMCGRTRADGGVNTSLAAREISLADFRAFFPADWLRRLRRLRLCGNFGDPAVSEELPAIVEYARSVSPALGLTLNTNGGVRSEEWWFSLGRFFSGRRDVAKFALDGLADTHAIYRRRTSWERVIANASAFLRGGGRADWVFLVFRHNEHQVEEARALAARLGFRRFTRKRTKRFRSAEGRLSERRAVKDREGEVVDWLELPSDPRLVNPALQAEPPSAGSVACRAEAIRGLYVSAEGLVFPCCWTAASLYPAEGTGPAGPVWERIVAAGGKEILSLRHRPLADILGDARFPALFPDARLPVCRRLCGAGAVAFDEQFETEAL